jgi:NAD(P)-dependent dehydrogenase (short-subunit alcohol dehydrogenase family)
VGVFKFALRTATVLAQTFILPGTSVRSLTSLSHARILLITAAIAEEIRSRQGCMGWCVTRVAFRHRHHPQPRAVVTGASDGIGAEFAIQLAQAGLNVLLIARDHDKLSAVAAKIQDRTLCNWVGPLARTRVNLRSAEAAAKGRNVSTGIHVIDFVSADDKAFQELASLCADLDVGVLGAHTLPSHTVKMNFGPQVNNVGKSHAMPVYFSEAPKDEIDDILNINVNGTVNVTYALLPQMIQRFVCNHHQN